MVLDLDSLDFSKPPPAVPDPDKIPMAARLAAINRALALPERTAAAVAEAVGPEMVAECPAVCALLSNPAADVAQLRQLLAIVDERERGALTAAQADAIVGQVMYDRYVKDAAA